MSTDVIQLLKICISDRYFNGIKPRDDLNKSD